MYVAFPIGCCSSPPTPVFSSCIVKIEEVVLDDAGDNTRRVREGDTESFTAIMLDGLLSVTDRLVTSPATAKSKSSILKSKSKSTLNGQVQVRVQVLFKKGKSKSKSKSSKKKRTCKQFYPIPILFVLLLLSKTLYRTQKRTNL